MGEDGSVINKDNTPVLHFVQGKIWVNNHAHVLTEKKNLCILRFIYYVLSVKDVSAIVNGTPPKINQNNLRNIPILLPPLPIQHEIVSVLDSFSRLQSKLEEELAVRQKQMEFYREKLLTFDKDDNSVKWMKLGEIVNDCFAGATPSTSKKEYWEGGTIPWMSSGEVHQERVYSVEKRITQLGYDNSSTKMVPLNSIVIALAGQGKTRGCVAITRTELCTNQSLCSIVVNQSYLIPEYLFYYLKSKYMELRNVSSGDGARGGLNLTMIKNYCLSVPSLSRQQEIVSTLDTMSSLIDKLRQEIEQRRKQYEYYREALLSF